MVNDLEIQGLIQWFPTEGNFLSRNLDIAQGEYIDDEISNIFSY